MYSLIILKPKWGLTILSQGDVQVWDMQGAKDAMNTSDPGFAQAKVQVIFGH